MNGFFTNYVTYSQLLPDSQNRLDELDIENAHVVKGTKVHPKILENILFINIVYLYLFLFCMGLITLTSTDRGKLFKWREDCSERTEVSGAGGLWDVK